HRHQLLGRVAIARQRATRLLGLGRRRSARLAQLDRHQESGGRQVDRPRHLRERPRRAGGGDARARPRAAVELLRRAAVDLRQGAQRALGPVRPSGDVAEIRHVGLPDHLVVGRAKGRQGAAAIVITRRQALVLPAGAIAAANFISSARAQDAERHGMSAFGDLKYPADFQQFTYVDPHAPKGGRYSEVVSSRTYNGSFLTFNSLNGYILKGNGAFGMDNTFATLMVRSGDEPDAMYGLAARAVRISGDGLTYQFLLRPEAKFHDGAPLTAQDVAFSLATLKEKGHPLITQLLRDFKGAEANDDHTVTVRFAEKRARDVPLFVAGLPIFSHAYYSKKNFDESTLDIPLGSGAYKVG